MSKAIKIGSCGLCHLYYGECPVNKDIKNCPLPDWPKVSREDLYKFLSETMMIDCSDVDMIDAMEFLRSRGIEVED